MRAVSSVWRKVLHLRNKLARLEAEPPGNIRLQLKQRDRVKEELISVRRRATRLSLADPRNSARLRAGVEREEEEKKSIQETRPIAQEQKDCARERKERKEQEERLARLEAEVARLAEAARLAEIPREEAARIEQARLDEEEEKKQLDDLDHRHQFERMQDEFERFLQQHRDEKDFELESKKALDVIDQLPQSTFLRSPDACPSLDDDKRQCAICLTPFVPKVCRLTTLQCLHYFHTDCVDPWLRELAKPPLCKPSCPVCRNVCLLE